MSLDVMRTDPAAGFDGRVGEGWAGTDPNGCHINVVLGRRGSATAAAVAAALATPRPGHLPFVACLERGAMVRPATIVVNKVPLEGEAQSRYVWGAAQLGIAQGVLDAIASGVLDAALADELLLLVPVWVSPDANDETAVRKAGREAMAGALADAFADHPPESVAALAERRESGSTPYYSGD